MKALKIIVALILSAMMICSASLTLASFACEKATSAESIRSAIDQTDIVDSLMNEVLRKNTVNMGGSAGTAANQIMQTDSMKNFISEYMTATIESQLCGRGGVEIASDELMTAFATGVEEASAQSGLSLDPEEEEMIRVSMQQSIPFLTGEIENSLNAYDTTSISSEMRAVSNIIPLLVKPMFQYGYIIISLLCALSLIVLFWSSRMGFMWAAVNTLLASAAFAVITLVSQSLGGDAVFVDVSQRMFYLMCADGAKFSAIAGGISGVILLILCVVMRTVRRPL